MHYMQVFSIGDMFDDARMSRVACEISIFVKMFLDFLILT